MVVRAGLRYLLDADAELEFAGEFGGGEGAADFVLAVKPDAVLLDVRMPDKNGIEALKDILAADPRAKVVMLTTSDTEEDVFRAIEEGAMGYVIKDSPVEVIAAAIRSAVAGDVYMTDDIRRIYETRKGVKGLSPREAEVLAVAAKGCGNREIGQRLGISENSVKIHLKRAFFKLGAADRAEAVTIAIQRGFVAGF
jgi:DNA-binding NarL/FixJ family response regulator